MSMRLGSLLARIDDTETSMRRLLLELSRDQVGPKSGLSAEQQALLAQMTDEHDVATLMQWVGRSNRSKFREVVLTPLLALALVEMTIPDKPNSSKQRYRLTAQGRALRDEVGQ